jgi:hypothetical protein
VFVPVPGLLPVPLAGVVAMQVVVVVAVRVPRHGVTIGGWSGLPLPGKCP